MGQPHKKAKHMNHTDLETTYESLALKIDQIGEKNSELFLAKLVLLLAHANGNVEHVQHIFHTNAPSHLTPQRRFLQHLIQRIKQQICIVF